MPHFVGLPEDVALAKAAWQGATACTGRPGAAAPVVELVRRVVPGDYLGVARTDPDDGRLIRIDLNTEPDRHREVVVHEVSHAWVSEGPVALVEGTAELIADCIVAARPELAPLQYDDGRALAGLPDLRRWSKPREGAPSELHAIRTDGYVGASRLMRTAARIVGPEALWAAREVSWAHFDATLKAAGPRGAELVAALNRGGRGHRERPGGRRSRRPRRDRRGLARHLGPALRHRRRRLVGRRAAARRRRAPSPSTGPPPAQRPPSWSRAAACAAWSDPASPPAACPRAAASSGCSTPRPPGRRAACGSAIAPLPRPTARPPAGSPCGPPIPPSPPRSPRWPMRWRPASRGWRTATAQAPAGSPSGSAAPRAPSPTAASGCSCPRTRWRPRSLRVATTPSETSR